MDKWGLKINPYERYVSNKTIDRRQCTIIWNVNDLNISYVSSNVVDDIFEILDKECDQDPETLLKLHCRKAHDYLGMTINYSTKVKVVSTMFDYIQDVLDELPEEFHGRAETTLANRLFYMYKENEKLNKEDGSICCRLLAKVL